MKNLKVHSQVILEPSKTLVYTVVVLLLLGLAYFIYNFYVCHKKKIDYGLEGEDDNGIEIQQRKDNL
jgi:nucleoside recognition membrane protein YjiH